MSDEYILVINPGSTSSKLALYKGAEKIAEENVTTAATKDMWSTFGGRVEQVKDFHARNGAPQLAAVVGRGGLIQAVPSGTIRVTQAMVDDCRAGKRGEHPSNFGCVLADAIARPLGIPAFIVDSVAVDELSPLARYSGHPLIVREALSHALNMHAAARKAAEKLGKKLPETRFVVVHLGGGISVTAMEGGRQIDCNNAISDGPFAPNRTGGLPVQALVELCFSGKYTPADLKKMTMKEGGLKAYLGTDDARIVQKRVEEGDAQAAEVYEAMAYQVAKEIGAMVTVLKGKLDAIVLTGGVAYDDTFTGYISERVSYLAPVMRFPGAFEMEALALGALRVLRGEEQALDYPYVPKK
jgi:butyrate kinase